MRRKCESSDKGCEVTILEGMVLCRTDVLVVLLEQQNREFTSVLKRSIHLDAQGNDHLHLVVWACGSLRRLVLCLVVFANISKAR